MRRLRRLPNRPVPTIMTNVEKKRAINKARVVIINTGLIWKWFQIILNKTIVILEVYQCKDSIQLMWQRTLRKPRR